MKKRVLNLLLAMSMTIGLLAGCANEEEAKELPKKLTFTYVTAPLNVPSIVDKEKKVFVNAFEELGIDVEYAELTSGADQTQALASGDVQVLYAVGASSAILSAANGADIKVLNMYSRSPKAFSMHANDNEIDSPEDLKGKTIAGPAGTNLHELLAAYLAAADMTIEDVNFVNMGIPEAKAALDGGSADVALLAGATAFQANEQGYHMVADGEGLIDAIIAVAVTDEFYQNNPEIIEVLEKAQEEIADFITQNEADAFEMTAKELGLDVEAVREMYGMYDFSTEITSEDVDGFQKTADFMYENGMIEENLDVTTLFY